MPSPKVSREQGAAMRKEIRELKDKLISATRVTQRTSLTRFHLPNNERLRYEIDVARALGFAVEVVTDGDVVALSAVKRVNADA